MEIYLVKNYEELEHYTSIASFIDFLYTHLGEYGDKKSAIKKAIDYAFSAVGGKGGFVLIGTDIKNEVIGGVVINKTAMSSYIPENILVYITVHEDQRGKGFGGELVEKTLKVCEGDIALHVDFDNPAKRLYERNGFKAKYIEMRHQKDS